MGWGGWRGTPPKPGARRGTPGCPLCGDTPGTPLLRGEHSPAPGGHRHSSGGGGRDLGVSPVPSRFVLGTLEVCPRYPRGVSPVSPSPALGELGTERPPRDPMDKVAAAGAGPGRLFVLRNGGAGTARSRGGRGEGRGLGQTDGHRTSICHPPGCPCRGGATLLFRGGRRGLLPSWRPHRTKGSHPPPGQPPGLGGSLHCWSSWDRTRHNPPMEGITG